MYLFSPIPQKKNTPKTNSALTYFLGKEMIFERRREGGGNYFLRRYTS